MAAFSNKEELYQTLGALWDRIKAHPEMSKRLLAEGLIIRFNYKDPDACITIDCSDHQEIKVYPDHSDLTPTVEMTMKSDWAHRFWQGKENVPAAMLQGKLVSKGSVAKALGLLPTIKPAFAMYNSVLEEAA